MPWFLGYDIRRLAWKQRR